MSIPEIHISTSCFLHNFSVYIISKAFPSGEGSKKAPRLGRPGSLAAAAVIFAAATHVAAIAEQQDQNDDPPPVVVQASAQAVIIVAHKLYLRDFSLSIAAHTPCYDPGSFLCSPENFLVN